MHACRDSKRLHVKNRDSGATVPLSNQKEGTIAHVDKPSDKPRVSRVKTGRGSSQQRTLQSGGWNTRCYRCGGGTKHRDVYRYKDYECHYCRKKRAPCIRVLQEKEGLISATQTNHQVVAESSNEEEYVMYRIWQQSNETTHCGCQTEWNHDSCGSRHRCIRLHYE